MNIPGINTAITLKSTPIARVYMVLQPALSLCFQCKCFTYGLEWITNHLPSEQHKKCCCWERCCFYCTEIHLILLVQLSFLEARAGIQHAIRYGKKSIVLQAGRVLAKTKLKEKWIQANPTVNSQICSSVLPLEQVTFCPSIL